MNTLSSGYRRFIWQWWVHYIDPRTYYRYFKYKVQRANRGWADCDVWSLDNYIAEWMPAALKRLQKTKQGIPMVCFPETPEYIRPDGNPTGQATEIAEKNWDEILQKMIAGFEAYNRIENSPTSYEPEIGNFPSCNWIFEKIDGSDFSRLKQRDEDKAATDAWVAQEKPLIERDQKTWEEGAELFIKYFGNLWD